MKLKTFIVLLLALAQCLVAKQYLKLQQGVRLQKGDELVSTLGLFKLIMNDNDCSLNYYKFNKLTQNYTSINKTYSGNAKSSCKYLNIINNRILTDNSTLFLQLTPSNFTDIYLMVDDYAVIRFIGIKGGSGNVGPNDYEQIQYTNYSQPNQYVAILDSYNQIADKVVGTSNNNNWIFQVNPQQITITNPIFQISQNFNVPQLYFTINGLYNANNQTFPAMNFMDSFLYQTACSGEKNKLYGPFVVQISEYLPKLTIYDQERYIVFQYTLLKSQYNTNPCPKFTFSLNGKCFTSCPSPYIQQVKGQRGTCVLNCQYGSTIDSRLNTCTCQNKVGFVSPTYNCINSSSYYFGCFCQNGTFFDTNTYTCQTNCTNITQPYLGLCLSCEKGCSGCAIAFNGLYYLNCTKCQTGHTLSNGFCTITASCSPNCLLCSNSLCVSCQPFYTLENGTCKQRCGKGQVLTQPNLTSACTSLPLTNICNVNCLKCSTDFTCVICQLGYALLVTPISITCRKKNVFYSCKGKTYTSSINSNVCYSNDSSSLSALSKCANSIPNCLVCHNKLNNICLLCKQGFLLQQNICVRQCLSSYAKVNQGCIQKIGWCQINSFEEGMYSTLITSQKIKSPQYIKFINNGLQLTNQPYGYNIYFMNLFTFKSDVTTTNSNIEWARQTCAQCQRGFGLTSNKTACVPCPQGCLLCLYANACMATTNEQVNAFTVSSSLSGCQHFISSQHTCIQSCPQSTIPILNETLQKMYCSSSQLTSVQGYVKVDGSTYAISNNKYIHRFVFDSIISVKKIRLLQENNLTIDASGNSITFQNDRPTQILNLTGTLMNFVAANGQYPSNSVYGINQQTSFRIYIKKWLAGIGYVLSIIIIIIHCVYIANNILYKMDNIIIFIQSIYYFLFTRILISNPVAQYYYGFSWAHLNFFPNYFQPQLNLSQPTIPPYALYNLDANIVRNAGSSLSLMFTFTFIWGLTSSVIYLLDQKYGRKQLWYFKIFKNSIIAVLQFVSYNIFYWCIAFTNYDKNYVNSGTFIGLSVLLLTIFIIYIIGRMYFNLIAGIYMAKRLTYACVLASSYQHVAYLAILIAMELIFGAARSFIEKPRERWMLISLWTEQGFIILFLIILYATDNASVVSILTTIFIYCWLLTFIADLSDLYFLSKNKHLQISCFKKLFQSDQQNHVLRSTQSKEQTDRQISSNNKQHQK